MRNIGYEDNKEHYITVSLSQYYFSNYIAQIKMAGFRNK
jgi:hypothetical protein